MRLPPRALLVAIRDEKVSVFEKFCDWILLSKAYKDIDKKICFTTLKRDSKFEEKLTLGSKNDMGNTMNFPPTTQIPKILV